MKRSASEILADIKRLEDQFNLSFSRDEKRKLVAIKISKENVNIKTERKRGK